MKMDLLNMLKEQKAAKSAWSRGVNAYAIELIESVTHEELEKVDTLESLEKLLLNGARNWKEYSYGGCSLIYDGDIAKRLCNSSELKRTDNGRKEPNKSENWLDVQARALYQAFYRVYGISLLKA